MKIFVIIFILITAVTIPGMTQSNQYDAFNRLISIEYGEGEQIIFSYDKLGNRTGYTIISSRCNKLVTHIGNTDFGSLRYNIDCAMEGDTIQFAAVMNNSTIELESPTIEVDKELYLIAPLSYNITLSNKDTNNTEVLINISDNLYIEGLSLIGKTEESMILKISPGGSLQLQSGEMDRINIKND